MRIRALRAAMVSCGVSQEQLARRCDVNRRRVQRWLTGTRFEAYVAAMGSVGERYLELLAIEQIVRRVG